MQEVARARRATGADDRFVLLDRGLPEASFAADVRRGLTARPKALPPRWFYDALGSALFEAICQLPEYYVTRAESEILRESAGDIARAFGAPVRLVELGSGSARKTRYLLDAVIARQQELEYVALDVDGSMLEQSGAELLARYPSLRLTAVRADFTRPSLALQGLLPHDVRNVVLFLGSTIGNLDPDDAAAMLRDLRSALGAGDALFLGADLRKDGRVLIPAYDDALHVTAAFNRNLLLRINRELGGAFPLDAFAHEARYDPTLGRVEMHLVSRSAQRIRIEALDLEIELAAGESIHTESSYKYDEASLEALARGGGFAIERRWSDAGRRFSDLLLVAR